MIARLPNVDYHCSAGRRAQVALGLLLGLLAFAPCGFAQAPSREEGVFIALQPPITRDVVNRVKAATERALESKEPAIRKIIYDFNPGGRASTSTDYGDCRDLADYLLKRRTVKTIAFVHGEPRPRCAARTGLPGDCRRRRQDRRRPARSMSRSKKIRFASTRISRGRRPAAVILKMLDPRSF